LAKNDKISTFAPLFGVTAAMQKSCKACCVGRQTTFNHQKMDLIKVAEEAFATGKQFPEFKAGDTIKVSKEKNSEKLKFDIVSAE